MKDLKINVLKGANESLVLNKKIVLKYLRKCFQKTSKINIRLTN